MKHTLTRFLVTCSIMALSGLSLCAEAGETTLPAGSLAPWGVIVVGDQSAPERQARVELSLDVDNPKTEWHLKSRSTTESRYTWQEHTLILWSEGNGSQQLIRFRIESPVGEHLVLRGYTARVRVPIAGLHAITIPSTAPIAHTLIYYHEHKKWPETMRIYRALIPQGFKDQGDANHEAPFILLTDNQGNNRIAAGWTAAERATGLVGSADGDSYVLTLSRKDDIPLTGDRIEDALFLNVKPEPWWNVMRAYAKTFDELNRLRHPEPPAWTTEPVFCTWYCYLDHIDQEGVLKIARKCKELGFGTILIDAGWDCRPDGGYGDFENGILGDFAAAPDRFPDLPGTIRQIHEMGLRVELWSAPFWQGKKSRAYQEKTKDWHAWTPDGENQCLCPKHPGMKDYLRDTFAQVARKYGVDGMWLDAADSVPAVCTAKHEHTAQPMGAAFTDCLAAIHEGLRSVNPDAITEARVLHANLQTKRALDVVQPSDAPESFEVLRLAAIQIRAWAYDVALKNDPMFWKKDADATLVGKFLATMVCSGVPALSVDFLTAPEEHCRLTAAWLTFYKQHKDTLLRGDFRLFGADYGMPDMMLVGKDEAVVYLRNAATREVSLPKPVRTIILLNCTDADDPTLRITPSGKQLRIASFRPDWTAQGEAATIEVKDDTPVHYRVLQGAGAIVEIR
jgi:alpha-galactosidase